MTLLYTASLQGNKQWQVIDTSTTTDEYSTASCKKHGGEHKCILYVQ